MRGWASIGRIRWGWFLLAMAVLGWIAWAAQIGRRTATLLFGLGGPAVRLLVSPLELPGDLPFADDHAVEAGGHAEQVAHGVRVVPGQQVRANVGRRQAVEFAQKLGQ